MLWNKSNKRYDLMEKFSGKLYFVKALEHFVYNNIGTRSQSQLSIRGYTSFKPLWIFLQKRFQLLKNLFIDRARIFVKKHKTNSWWSFHCTTTIALNCKLKKWTSLIVKYKWDFAVSLIIVNRQVWEWVEFVHPIFAK